MDAIQRIKNTFDQHSLKTFLINSVDGKKYSYSQIYTEALLFSAELRRIGLSKGDRLAIILPNSIEHAVLLFACMFSGITTVPINQTQTVNEILVILSESKTTQIICNSKSLEKLTNIRTDLKIHLFSDILESKHNNFTSPNKIEAFENVTENDILTIVFTSGTTGTPKGVIHKIKSLINNAYLFCNEVKIDDSNRFYNLLSMSYLGGYYNLLLLPFVAGSSVVIAEAFSPHSAMDFWPPIIKHRINTLWLVPTIISIILEFDRKEIGVQYSKENIKLTLVGTAPLTDSIKNAFENRYGVELVQNYGLSETLFISTQRPSSEDSKGVGKILSGVNVEIRKLEDKNLEKDEEGEIYVKTPYLMAGYFNREIELDDSFFPTGDIGYINDGHLIISGRKKDLIIRSGLNISPLAIENMLQQHESIGKCAVIGIPHKINGEDIVAVISLKNGADFSTVKKELFQLCDQKISSSKRPSMIFQTDSFPMSSSGKIQKNTLKKIIQMRISKSDFSPIKSAPEVKKCAIGMKVKKKIDRPSDKLISRISEFPTTIVSDALNRMGAVSSAIQAICKNRPFCGPAFTVDEVEGSNMMNHIALDLLRNGDVMVISGKGITSRSCWGGLQTLRACKVGASAVIIDGAVRDYDDIKEYNLPIYARGVSLGGPIKAPFGRINYPISFGGVAVSPGDIVMGDNDGIVVVPQRLVEEVIHICQNKLEQEAKWFNEVESGKSALKTVGINKFLEKQSIDYE
ncbi:AMP-binding protein [Maridesulfovibrio hydrothermalis]|uniref:Putative o-succinylbenzoate--CoA ligase n=1 Tax=Maridesulfovibrio hydrothermalis AM13 = DSM 14728 TaxID=1121451 RepID=L0RAK2_9BACT|nr:AMP-binding protein [Maridesulfovibrio hydrothermalis]CCO23220.1 putative o-succinylbenzoate--CoA ligase [Maridesulfovibrio hydrothermalis AM13 = DSM 14728]